MATFVELLLLRASDGSCCVAVVPTGRAHAGDIAVIDGDMLVVERTAWSDPLTDIHEIIKNITQIYTPDKILHEKYDKEGLRVDV